MNKPVFTHYAMRLAVTHATGVSLSDPPPTAAWDTVSGVEISVKSVVRVPDEATQVWIGWHG